MTDREKDESIDYILSQGLVKPQNVYERVREMLNTLGFRFIFWDTSYSIFITAVTLVGTILILLFAPNKYSHSIAVGFAPMLFFIITLFAETSERVSGLYELKQTCRYTIRQITALRVMCYSVAGIVFAASIAAMNTESVTDFLTLLPLCFSTLFLCALVQLSAIRFLRNEWATVVISLVWAFFNLAIPFTLGERWEMILRDFPFALGIALALISAILLSYQTKKMLLEVNLYAVA